MDLGSSRPCSQAVRCAHLASCVQASLSQRPRRTSSIVRPSMKEASSQDESEEAIEKENNDEDFLA